ncbi:hypothetical protein THRCLA_20485 [Thraustotheca clavata]|uniref:Uncharacterized protein n=1 Tax=Thraustotheca clavata TaxID=74557 RepID=A0A1W0A6T1_9STRA|nr:hypothetical protein THRCLA_20485 [Thraustotheca clavata]
MTVAMASAAIPPLLPKELSTIVDTYTPVVSAYASSALPATVGNCSAANAPKPCQDVGDLYATKSSFYDIQARWISGLNTINVNTVKLTYDANGTMNADVSVTFKSLPMSLHVDVCLPGAGCSKLLDNTDTCCGGPKTISATATVACSEVFPYLRNATVSNVSIAPALEVMYNISGKPTALFDATSVLQKELAQQGTTLLQNQGLTLLNEKIKQLYGDTIFCTQTSQLAWIAKNPQNSGSKSNAPATTTTSPKSHASFQSMSILCLFFAWIITLM